MRPSGCHDNRSLSRGFTILISSGHSVALPPDQQRLYPHQLYPFDQSLHRAIPVLGEYQHDRPVSCDLGVNHHLYALNGSVVLIGLLAGRFPPTVIVALYPVLLFVLLLCTGIR